MTDKLNEYRQKRDFEISPEPQGTADEGDNSLRFVVQHHLARRDHYDFRLEWEGSLLSWAVPKGPSYNPADKRLAVRVEDHPLEYRNFEGTIPKGEYGGGTVMLWDEGFWEPLTDVRTGLNEGSLKLVLKGRRLKGKWALVRMKARDGETKENWLLLKEKDDYAKAKEGITEFSSSIRTGRLMDEIEKGESEKVIRNPFDKTEPQLAKLVAEVPKGEDWLYELKYDGYRIIAYVGGNSVRLMTRNGNDYTNRFRAAAASLLDLASGRAMVLDGEMAVTDEAGKTDFQALQNYMKDPGGRNLTYIIFDLLSLDGADLRNDPLIKRKEKLQELLKDAPANLNYSRHVEGDGEKCFEAACELGMEGVVGKKSGSIYSGTRNGDWVKLKCDNRQEFVIGGFTLSDKKSSGISSLLLGVYEDGELIYAGRAGTGLSEREMRELEETFKPLNEKESPFRSPPKARSNEEITWLKPELSAEIKFAEWTKEGLLRQASFKGLRTDKKTDEIKREREEEKTPTSRKTETNVETLTINGVKITSPDKLIFDDPPVKKEDVVRYYAQIAERMLPYVKRRVLSIVRCPKGINESCFFKKHPGASNKGIVIIPVPTGDGGVEDYFYIENETGLIYEAQMGTLEFHVWGSSEDTIERPDMMVFDLDPDEGMELETVRQGVKDLKELLSELSLVSFLKTSGGKGYHVVVPLRPTVSWDTFHDFARRVAEVMESKWPDRYTSNVRKAKRTDKIFIDWIRNGRGATSVAPYSIRARKGAKVSMPISWEELYSVAPNGVDMKDALHRAGGEDPWKSFFTIDQQLK